MPTLPEHIDDPDFTFAGGFLDAHYNDATRLHNDTIFQSPSDIPPDAPGALQLAYFSGRPYSGYEPFKQSRQFSSQEATMANEIVAKPIADTAALERRRDLLGSLAGSGQLLELAETIGSAKALTTALNKLLTYHPESNDGFGFDDEHMVYETYVTDASPEIRAPQISKTTIPTEVALARVLSGVTKNTGSLERAAEVLAAIDPSFVPSAENLAHLGQRIGATLSRTAIDAVRAEIKESDSTGLEWGERPYDAHLARLPGYGLRSTRYDYNSEFGNDNRKPGDWMANVDARIIDLAVVVTLATMIAEDGWHPAVPGAEAVISSGWKFQQPKELQTAGDGLFDEYPIVGLVSSNGSGKTFATERDFGLRNARQTLGYIPASEPNSFEPHTSFNMLGRHNSFGRGDHGELVNELQRWKQTLKGMGDHPVFYLDEAMSTASPLGQAALNLAFARYIQENGGFVSLATHNEHVANTLEQWTDAGLYTFGQKDGLPYQMVEGSADSGFIDLVRSRELGERYADLMEAYLNGSLDIAYAPNYPAVPTGYSEAERHVLMQASGGLAYMFPEAVNSPSYVLLSEDSGAMSDHSNEAMQLLYYSDPVSFTELIERQRSIRELADYAELGHLMADLTTLHDHLEPFLQFVANKSPSELLAELNPIKHFVGIEPDSSKDFDNDHLVVKLAAYADLLATLLPDQSELTGLRQLLTELTAELASETEAYQQALQSDGGQGYFARLAQGRQYKSTVRGISQRAFDLALPVVGEFGTSDNVKDKFWLTDNIKPILTRLAQPSPVYDVHKEEYVATDKPRVNSKDNIFLALGISPEGQAALLLAEPEITSALGALNTHSDNINSVHIRQGVAYLQRLIARQPDAQPAQSNPQAVAWKSKYSPLTNGRSQQSYDLRRMLNKQTEITKAINQLTYLKSLAEHVAAGDYSLVDFNATGEVRLDGVQDIASSEKHLPFDYGIAANQAAVALSGEHSAGKTYSTRHIANAMLMAMKTGVVPASYGSMPYFERISYISRVAQEMDADRSAGQQEVDIWADHDRVLATAQTAITFADEVGSSTSPKYQAAFAAAAVAVNAARGQRLVVTTHHDGLLDFAETTTAFAVQGIHHDDAGKRTIDGTKVISNPIPFARRVGLPPRLIELAETYYDRLTVQAMNQ